MKNITYRSSLLLIGAALLFSSCKPNLTAEAPSAGSADFSRYLAVGNSLTAGYADGSLYRSGQENSYPALLAKQFTTVGGGNFKQPLLPSESGYPNPKLMLMPAADCQGVTSLSPRPVTQGSDTAGSSSSIASAGPFNNLGVPGIRCIDYLLPGYALIAASVAKVPYAARFFKNPAGSPLEEVVTTTAAVNPTFFSLWIGNNDVLGYATSGGSGKSSNGSFLDQNSISSVSLFQQAFDSLFNTVTRNNAKGIVIGIPDVTAIPYFTTVPIKGLALTRQGQADSLNGAYAQLIAAGTVNKFMIGANYFVIQDINVPGGRRSLKEGEYLTLTIPQDSLKCRFWGSQVPIPSQFVLDATEVEAVRVATTAFNTHMSARAASKGLLFVDIGAYLKTVATGVTFNGVTYNTTFVTGGTFSLDGVHLTPRGYAIVANYFIQTINAKWGSTIPALDANQFGGVRFP